MYVIICLLQRAFDLLFFLLKVYLLCYTINGVKVIFCYKPLFIRALISVHKARTEVAYESFGQHA